MLSAQSWEGQGHRQALRITGPRTRMPRGHSFHLWSLPLSVEKPYFLHVDGLFPHSRRCGRSFPGLASSSVHFKPRFSSTARVSFRGWALYDTLISPDDVWPYALVPENEPNQLSGQQENLWKPFLLRTAINHCVGKWLQTM